MILLARDARAAVKSLRWVVDAHYKSRSLERAGTVASMQLSCSLSHFPSSIQGGLNELDETTKRKILVNRLLYRSKQRGFLEMDLLVGLWAEKHVPLAGEAMLQAFEDVLDQENPELYKWLTGQAEAPEAMRQNAAFEALQSSVGVQLKQIIGDKARTRPGAEWVRGWDDWKSKDAGNGGEAGPP